MLFGKKNEFAFEYNLIKHPYGDEFGLLLDSWGELCIWVEGVDLLAMYTKDYQGENKNVNYQWNLIMITEWLADNLFSIISPCEFPNNVKAENSIEYVEISRDLTPGIETNEFWQWHDNDFEWLEAHCLRRAADGSNLPYLFFRRAKDKVEICWSNEGLYDDRGVFFCGQKGCKLVDMNIFYKVAKDFLNNFINRFKDKYPVEMKELQDKISLN
jgi:hypothetical protein